MALVEPPPNTDLLAKALHIETEILNAFTRHDLDNILDRWTNLENQLKSASKDGIFSLTMKNQVYCISERIRLYSQSFSDVIPKAASLEPNYMNTLDNLHLTLDSPQLPLDSRSQKPFFTSLGHPSQTPPPQNSATAYDPTPLPEFIEHAYKHFVANIHNPYPSREEKQAIVDMSSSSRVTLTSVSNWFTNARRRCGWAEILKSRCKGNREEMIDISKRIFLKEDPTRPVDAQIVAEFMEMKKNVETMYEKKTRTSAWIEDLDQLVNTISFEKHRGDDLKNRQVKKKNQAETLCKADKTPRRIQRDQDSQNGLSRTASLSSFTSSGSIIEDDEYAFESNPVFDGKRKSSLEDRSLLHLRGSSPASSLSSFSFTSEFSDSRVPSLSWSDSGDDERPRKRPRSNADTSISSSPVSSELTFPLDDSFNLNPSSPANSLIIPTRGRKRSYDTSLDIDATPTAKRIRSDFTQITQDADIASPNAGPISDFMTSSTATSHRRSSFFSLVDFDSLLTLGTEEPQPVEITPPDTSVPLEVGVFDWSNPLDSFDFTGGLGMNVESITGSENPLSDFSELFQMITSSDVTSGMPADNSITSSSPDRTGVDAGVESPQSGSDSLYALEHPSSSHSIPDLQVDLSSFNLTSLWPQTEIPFTGTADVTGGHALDLSGLISSPIPMQTLDGFDFNYSMQPPAQMPQPVPIFNNPLETSRFPSVSPTCASTSVPTTPATQDVVPLPDGALSASDNKKETSLDLTGQDLAMVEKALRKEYKRRELEEKKAALERERARLEELERELEDD